MSFLLGVPQLLGLYSTSKALSNPIGFVDIGLIQCLFSSNIEQTQSWEMFGGSLKKSITKIFYCRSPLKGEQKNDLVNVLARIYVGSQKMHHEIIVEVDDQIYFLMSYSCQGLEISGSFEFDQLINQRQGNEIKQESKCSSEKKVGDLIDYLKKIPHSKKNYDPILYNCQKFSKKVWDFLK